MPERALIGGKKIMNDYIQVITTVDSRDIAEKIARDLLQKRLVACVQIIPCHSMYRWQGIIEKDGEYLCIMKSSREIFPELETAIKSVHPYEVPEILAVEVINGNSDYLNWMGQELKNPS